MKYEKAGIPSVFIIYGDQDETWKVAATINGIPHLRRVHASRTTPGPEDIDSFIDDLVGALVCPLSDDEKESSKSPSDINQSPYYLSFSQSLKKKIHSQQLCKAAQVVCRRGLGIGWSRLEPMAGGWAPERRAELKFSGPGLIVSVLPPVYSGLPGQGCPGLATQIKDELCRRTKSRPGQSRGSLRLSSGRRSGAHPPAMGTE